MNFLPSIVILAALGLVACQLPDPGFSTDSPHDPPGVSSSTIIPSTTTLSTGETTPTTVEIPTSTIGSTSTTEQGSTALPSTAAPSVENETSEFLVVYIVVPPSLLGLLVFWWLLKRGKLTHEGTPSEAPILMEDLRFFSIATPDSSVVSWVNGAPSEVSEVTEWEFEHFADSVV